MKIKDLDPEKIYNLEKLNTKQFLTLLSRVNLDSSRFIGMENPCIVFYNDLWNATEETMQCEESVDAQELFEEGVMKIKDLDPTKVYDIEHLNREQKIAVYEWLVKNDKVWLYVKESDFVTLTDRVLSYIGRGWVFIYKNDNQVITNALELFEEEPASENKNELMDIEVDFEKVEVKKDDNKESESSLRYKEYIDLGFEREDINDQVRFNQSGYFGYILIKKLKKGLEIQVTDCSLNEPKLYLKHDFVLALSKQQVMALCR